MSAARILILGILQFKAPAHGYEIRRELESWRAEQWAHIAYGSIYFALGKMAEEGLVEAVGTDQVGNRPARTLYTITDAGKQEFERLLRDVPADSDCQKVCRASHLILGVYRCVTGPMIR